MRAKRQLILNDYHTAEDGLWTMSSCKLTKAAQVQTIVAVPGRYAPLDLSTSLTDGQPYYGNATLEAVLESSEGTREERQERIMQMVNLLDGHSVNIILPDHPARYLVGRVQVSPDYNDLAHCSVKVSAICEPWLYNDAETVRSVALTEAEKSVTLTNSGRLLVVPVVKATGETTLTDGTTAQTVSAGVYQLPWLSLSTGTRTIRCSGSGTVTFSYREAVLAE